jgi:DNA recombination protein Rad52
MALTEIQTKALKAKLNHRHIRTRESHGAKISYVEGWHVISEANRIFGFENWDRQTQTPECLWSETQRSQTVCFYSAKVRVTVRSGDTTTVREGIGTGHGRSPQAEVAHEMAVKAAETDATKRALATFGNPFGLALYDRHHAHVTKPREKIAAPPLAWPPVPLSLVLTDERTLEVTDIAAFVEATQRELRNLDSLETAYAFWTRNLATFTEISRHDETGAIPKLVAALKDRLREISRTKTETPAKKRSALLLPKETRVRDRDHLTFVAHQPCLVCGRRPAQAHHLSFAQPRAMSLKVSDEYAVPLCNTHHDALHRSGEERAWWARHGIIDPLKFAARLWAASRNNERAIFEEFADIQFKSSSTPSRLDEGTGNGSVEGSKDPAK